MPPAAQAPASFEVDMSPQGIIARLPAPTTYSRRTVPAAVRELAKEVEPWLDPQRAAGFDALKWARSWVKQPQPALGGRRPEELMHAPEGRDLVKRLLIASNAGVYW